MRIVLVICLLFIKQLVFAGRWSHPKLLILENEKKQYMAQGNLIREIPNEGTLKHLGLDIAKKKVISRSELHSFIVGPILPNLTPPAQNFDEGMRLWRLKVIILTKQQLYEKIVICNPCKDPSAHLWNNKVLLTAEITGGERSWFTSFAWANQSSELMAFLESEKVDWNENQNHFGISTESFGDISRFKVRGIDARTIVLNETTMYLFPGLDGNVYNIVLNITSTRSLLSPTAHHHQPQILNKGPMLYLGENKFTANKNWTPFLFNHSKILLIQQVNPFRVVELFETKHPENNSAVTIAKTFSEQPFVDLPILWPYGGRMRGGTNAVLLAKDLCDCYLSFFHLKTNYPNEGIDTVYFGAYIFSAEPPFRILAVSPYPIMDGGEAPGDDGVMFMQEWYTKKIDYVNYPMSIFLIDNGKTGVLTYCHNDIIGTMAKFNVRDLLDSLLDVGDEEYLEQLANRPTPPPVEEEDKWK